jgi:hypothetical protein
MRVGAAGVRCEQSRETGVGVWVGCGGVRCGGDATGPGVGVRGGVVLGGG